MTRPITRRGQRRPAYPGPPARALARHLPEDALGVTVSVVAMRAGLDDPRPLLRSLRRHGWVIERDGRYMLTPHGAAQWKRLQALPTAR